MEYKKIIFLDVDGVINIPPYNSFDLKCLNNLRSIIIETDSKVVISSSWREGDLERTKSHFPNWLKEYIIGETIRGYKQVKDGSSLPICRGNEIKHWIDRNLIYPWHARPELADKYKVYGEDGSFQKMKSYALGKDFVYVILDDDNDMLLEQKDYFIRTESSSGITKERAANAIRVLTQLKQPPLSPHSPSAHCAGS